MPIGASARKNYHGHRGGASCTYSIAIMPELGRMNGKQAASPAGLAPRANESGTRSRYRFIKGGRPQIRKLCS